MARIAFIGLGVMGFPLAGHLAAYHDVTVYNRTPSKAQAWASRFKGRTAATPRETANTQDFVVACVGNDEDLCDVTIGENGAFHTMKPGAVFIDHTTVSARLARKLHVKAGERSIGFIDAPVSGGQAGAENGALSIMCGGDAEAYARAETIMAAYAKLCRLMGPPGSGQLTKMVNQIAIAGLLQGLSEAIHFGQQAGLDIDRVLDVVSKGAAASWQMENRGRTMNRGEFDFGFAVDWMRKDLAICLDEADRNGANLPVTAIVNRFYAELQQAGQGREDTSSLITRLQDKAKD